MKLLWLLLVIWQLTNNANGSPNRYVRQTDSSCFTPAGEKGLCINIRRCNSLMTMMREQGKDPRIVAFLKKTKCGVDGKDPKACCPDAVDSGRILPESTEAPVTQPTAAPQPTHPTSDKFKCGESAIEPTRVVGGRDARLGNWPWMVGLAYRIRGAKTAPANMKCGATLISSQWVITAAHCVDDNALKELDLAYARVGDLDLDDKINDGANPSDALVDKFFIHSQYNNTVKQNDIALIRLKEPVQFSKNLHPICLLSGPQYKEDSFYDRKMPYVTGWGATGWAGKSTSILQEAQLKMVPHAKCQEQFSNVKGALINEKVLCAGENGKDTCQGDSGGPLIIPDGKTNLFYLGGVVSYGIGCNSGYPGVYTRIAQYIDWINEITGESF